MPLSDRIDSEPPDHPVWGSVLMGWAVYLTGWLNRNLPRPDYRADPDVTSGFRIGTRLREREAPPPSLHVPAIIPDVCEVHVSAPTESRRPVGVVVFVRPTTKQEPAHRVALVRTCLSYLQRGAGLVLVDVVNWGGVSIHDDLMAVLDPATSPPGFSTCVTGYRPVTRGERCELDVWQHPAVVGRPVPAVPLGLRGGPTLVLDLEGPYMTALEAAGVR